MAVRSLESAELGRLWEQVLESIKARIGSHQAFDTWFKPIVPRLISLEVVELEVPNAFFIDWLHEHYLTLLNRCLEATLGGTPAVRFTPREQPLPAAASARPLPSSAPQSGRASRAWLD